MANDPYNIVLTGWIGTPITWSVTVTAPSVDDPSLPGAPIDVSGFVAMFTLKTAYTDPDSAALYINDQTLPSGSTTGVISGEIPDSITETLEPSSYLFDLRIISTTSSEPQMLMAGKVQIRKTVGRRLTPNFTWTPS